MRTILAVALVVPMLLRAQDVTLRDAGRRASATIIRDAAAKPHVLLFGTARLDLPRDSTVTSTLIVLGRPTYLASHVQGDVIVVGADLFLRPGAEITGRAVAIGGTVALTTLGHAVGGTESFRDETYVATSQGNEHSLTFRALEAKDRIPLLQPAGLQGLMMPAYDRVDGLSLPVGALLTLGDAAVEVQPAVTYRSRLGKFDPSVVLRIKPGSDTRFEGYAAIDTRTNDSWNYADLINSATTFFAGSDTRNYFRSKIGEGRLFTLIQGEGVAFEPFIGARYERVSPITAAGNVYSVTGHKDVELEHIRRINPLVEAGDISSALIGAELHDTAGVVTSRVRANVEQSFKTVPGTKNFTQITLDGRLGFPTFKTQRLDFRAHAVATVGDSVPKARYAYLGGSGTLPVLELLELGGTKLLFVESSYTLPLEFVLLPKIGSPVVTLRHMMGSAGVASLPSLEQEIGVGIGLSALHFDMNTDVNRNRGTKFGVGISLTK
ncbi:MAG: hypothetical protein ABJE10_20275 [bacterium]